MRRLVLAACAAVLLSGCTPGTGAPTSPTAPTAPAPSRSAPDGGGVAPTSVPSIPPGLLECGKRPSAKDLQLADVDLSAAAWSLPSGYVEADGYYEDNPVETIETTWYAEPTDPPLPTLNVLNVVLYSGLDWGDLADSCGRVPLAAVEERLAQYRDRIDAEPLSDAVMTTVGGLPAVEQQISLERYDYHGYWLFSPTQLLHVYCQWTDGNGDVIEAGCADLVGSVRIG